MTFADTPSTAAPAPAAPIAWADPARAQAFAAWLDGLRAEHGLLPETVRAASADASFRRYFRIDTAAGTSLIAMDAPPSQIGRASCRERV